MKAFAFVMLLGGSAYSQNPTFTPPDSIVTMLNAVESDSAKVVIYSQLARGHKFSEPELTVSYGLKAIELASEAGLKTMEVDALTDLGYAYELQGNGQQSLYYYYKGYELAKEISYVKGAVDGVTGSGSAHWLLRNFEEAIAMYKEAIRLTSENEMIPWLADAHNNLGNVYLDQNKFEQALEEYQKSAKLLPDENRTKAIAVTNIGMVHLQLEDLSKSIEYFEEGTRLAGLQDDPYIEAYNYKQLGMVNRMLKNYTESLRGFNEALIRYERLKNIRESARVATNIGGVYYDMGDFEKSLTHYESSLSSSVSIGDEYSKAHSLSGIGRCNIELSRFSKAKSALEELLALSIGLKDNGLRRDAYGALGDLYNRIGRFQEAYQYQQSFILLNDSIFNETRSEQVAELEASYETFQKEKEIELLNAENEINELKLSRRESQRNILIATVIVFVILIFVLFNRYKIRTRANQKLRELDEMKSRFFTNISHEFRTPLTLILGPVENKLSSVTSDDEREQLLLIKRNADRLLELINQLLDLSKLEAGRLNLHVSEGDFHSFLRTTISSFESLAAQKKIQLEVDIPDEPLMMMLDTEKCQQIFYNLLSNAFKFTSEGGKILLRVTQSDKKVSVKVEDTGRGIPEDELGNIFKRFHQLDDSKHHQQGTGIGLALVKELVLLHHGEISVASTLNKGTVFTVDFPVHDSSYEGDRRVTTDNQEIKTVVSEVNQNVSVKESEMNLDGQYVLVVEDSDDVRAYVSSILADSYQVIEAKDGAEGIELAIQNIPDLIISDLMMPKVDGLELCEQLKNDEKTSHIPIIMLTAKADESSKLEGLDTGADDYLIKPFSEKELLIRVKNLITQRLRLKEHFGRKVTLEPKRIQITPPDEAFLNKAMTVVDEHISDFEFTVDLFQREMAMSRMQLHRKLKALTSCSASEFIRIQRLKRAAQILETEGVNVSEAAYKSGFNNLSYFAKCFKEEYKVSPSDYSKKLHTSVE